MSLPVIMPKGAKPILTDNEFTSTFNNPALGQYSFNVAANRNQVALVFNGHAKYWIMSCSFSLNCKESDFQTAIGSNGSPTVTFKTRKTGTNIFTKSQPFNNFIDNMELSFPIESNQSGDALLLDFFCILDQPAGLFGQVNLSAFLQLNIYQISDSDWVRDFEEPSRGLGDVKMRG